jgi:hypothetical protein
MPPQPGFPATLASGNTKICAPYIMDDNRLASRGVPNFFASYIHSGHIRSYPPQNPFTVKTARKSRLLCWGVAMQWLIQNSGMTFEALDRNFFARVERRFRELREDHPPNRT